MKTYLSGRDHPIGLSHGTGTELHGGEGTSSLDLDFGFTPLGVREVGVVDILELMDK